MEVRGDSKTIVDFIHGVVRQGTKLAGVGEISNVYFANERKKDINMKERMGQWTVTIFVNITEKRSMSPKSV